jgi:PAS domain-containing protein
MSSTSANGRPAGPDVSAVALLEQYEELARRKRRTGKPSLPSRKELADSVGRSIQSVTHWCHPDRYNLPWPIFSLDEAVCLIDALAPRFEILYANQAFCDLVDRTIEELLWQPAAFVKPSTPDGPEDRARRDLARALKAGEGESGSIDSWLVARDGSQIRVDAEMRYGPACQAYYVRVRPLAVAEPLPFNVVDGFYVDVDGHRQSGLPPAVESIR